MKCSMLFDVVQVLNWQAWNCIRFSVNLTEIFLCSGASILKGILRQTAVSHGLSRYRTTLVGACQGPRIKCPTLSSCMSQELSLDVGSKNNLAPFDNTKKRLMIRCLKPSLAVVITV